MKPNFGGEVRTRSPGGRTHIPDLNRSPETGNDNIGKLTLGHECTAQSSPEKKQAAAQPTSPTHCDEALPIAGSCVQPADDKSVGTMTLIHHSKPQSGGPSSGKRLESDRERPATSDPDFARTPTGSNKRLFDPERGSKDYQMQQGLEPGDGHPQKCHGQYKTSNLPDSGQDERKTALKDQPAPSPSSQGFDLDGNTEMDMEPVLLLQPETRPISHDQLIVEVKGIYAGLVMVESKCVDVDKKQLLEEDQTRHTKLSKEQWQALIHLHKTLLHEHHDFFLASQHPSAIHDTIRTPELIRGKPSELFEILQDHHNCWFVFWKDSRKEL